MLLCYITDRRGFAGDDAEQRTALLRRIAEAARVGVDYIQLREKDLQAAQLELLAREAIHLLRENSATTKLLINTHADIALAVGADSKRDISMSIDKQFGRRRILAKQVYRFACEEFQLRGLQVFFAQLDVVNSDAGCLGDAAEQCSTLFGI